MAEKIITLDNLKAFKAKCDETYSGGGSGGSVSVIETTYADLVAKKKAGTLTAGQWYRITDYAGAYIVELNSMVQDSDGNNVALNGNAGHQFDILVMATDKNELSEDCLAIANDNDSYFPKSEMSVGIVLSWIYSSYTLEASHTNEGTTTIDGTSYDVYTNSGVLASLASNSYVPSSATSVTTDNWYVLQNGSLVSLGSMLSATGQSVSKEEKEVTTKGTDFSAWKIRYSVDKNIDTGSYAFLTQAGLSSMTSSGNGWIYELEDEFGNKCSYDFKNLLWARFKITATTTTAKEWLIYNSSSNDFGWANGFESLMGVEDVTVDLTSGILVPTFASAYSSSASDLSIKGGTSFVFGNELNGNSNLDIVIYGIQNFAIKFEDICCFNTFGSDCYSNTFGSNCYSNTFGSYCSSNTFESDCYSNTFGSSCDSNTFGSSCDSNTFGSSCRYNTFGDYCQSNFFETTCQYNIFGTSTSSKINYCRYNHFDAGCSYIALSCSDTSASYSNQLQNVHISQGITGTSSSNLKSIVVEDRNLAYQVDYKPTGSKEILI